MSARVPTGLPRLVWTSRYAACRPATPPAASMVEFGAVRPSAAPRRATPCTGTCGRSRGEVLPGRAGRGTKSLLGSLLCPARQPRVEHSQEGAQPSAAFDRGCEEAAHGEMHRLRPGVCFVPWSRQQAAVRGRRGHDRPKPAEARVRLVQEQRAGRRVEGKRALH